MREQDEFEKWVKERARLMSAPWGFDGDIKDFKFRYIDMESCWQDCTERKDKHKQEILGALLIGLDAATEVAANYHKAMAGYRENQHKMLDDDVICIERAIAFLTGETE